MYYVVGRVRWVARKGKDIDDWVGKDMGVWVGETDISGWDSTDSTRSSRQINGQAPTQSTINESIAPITDIRSLNKH